MADTEAKPYPDADADADDVEQPKAAEETGKTDADGSDKDAAADAAAVGGSLINKSDMEKSHSHALTVSSRRDLEDTRTKPFVVIVAMAAALGGLIFGYDIGGAGATFLMDGFKIHFGWECAPDDLDCTPASDDEIATDKGLINGLFEVVCLSLRRHSDISSLFFSPPSHHSGAMVAPLLFDKLGRKFVMYSAAWIFILGAALQAAAVNMLMLQIPRLLSGGGIGMLSMCSPVYM
ncbi:MAG: hypothetical protein SGARI_004783 [Bacillariaceae sp.]